MATHSTIPAQNILQTEETEWVIVHGAAESDMTEHTCTHTYER